MFTIVVNRDRNRSVRNGTLIFLYRRGAAAADVSRTAGHGQKALPRVPMIRIKSRSSIASSLVTHCYLLDTNLIWLPTAKRSQPLLLASNSCSARISEETRHPAVSVERRRAGFGGPKRLPARDGRHLRREALHGGVLAQETDRAA